MSRVPKPAAHVRRPANPPVNPAAVPEQRTGPADEAGSVESLYPFIFDGAMDPAQVVAEAYQSTVAKTREIIDLRAAVRTRTSGTLASCAQAMAARFAAGGRLLVFGNGGSATDAAELATLFLYPPGDALSLPAMSLASDVSVVTALTNDMGVEVVFSRQIERFGSQSGIAIGLSTSGNSENLLRAFDGAS